MMVALKPTKTGYQEILNWKGRRLLILLLLGFSLEKITQPRIQQSD